jgi:hypothetical protein
MMEVILGGMHERHQSQASVAWLVDQVPLNLQHFVYGSEAFRFSSAISTLGLFEDSLGLS